MYFNSRWSRSTVLAAWTAAAISLGVQDAAWAAYKLELDEDRWISMWIGLRFEAGAQQESGRDTRKWEKNFTVDSIQPHVAGQVHQYIEFEAGFDYSTGDDGDNDIHLLDGVVKFQFNEQFNLWGGRFLPPTDRANFSGAYNLNTWAFPLVSQRYPQIYAGRGNGVAFWGYDPSGRLKYQVGVFEGNSDARGPSYDARLTLNLLDKETGYYNASTYFGEKNILAIGAVINAQHDGAGVDATGKDRSFVGWNVDLLFETKMSAAGSLMIDAAYFGYDNDGFRSGDNASGNPVAQDRADGDGFFVTVGWYLPGEYGFGSLKGLVQPTLRYQGYNNDQRDLDGDKPRHYQSRWDVGLNWYLRGNDAKVVLYYYHQDDNGSDNAQKGFVNETGRNGVHLGVQLQF